MNINNNLLHYESLLYNKAKPILLSCYDFALISENDKHYLLNKGKINLTDCSIPSALLNVIDDYRFFTNTLDKNIFLYNEQSLSFFLFLLHTNKISANVKFHWTNLPINVVNSSSDDFLLKYTSLNYIEVSHTKNASCNKDYVQKQFSRNLICNHKSSLFEAYVTIGNSKKFIGTFNSNTQAQEAINNYQFLKGFFLKDGILIKPY